MAASLNKVLLMGNLTRDPELRYLPSGQPVTSFSLAMNRTFNSQTGEKKEEVTYVRVVVWAKLAEICNEYLKKGSPVFVEGRLQSRSWEAQDGSKRSTIEVVAQNVQFLPRGQGRSGDASAPSEGEEAIYEDPDSFPAAGSSKGKGSFAANDLKPDEDVPF